MLTIYYICLNIVLILFKYNFIINIVLNMNKNTNICNNCGKQGHSFHQCKLPITSYGIIVFISSEKELQFLMIRRQNIMYEDFF